MRGIQRVAFIALYNVLVLFTFAVREAHATIELRRTLDQKGDMLVFGNTLGQDCDHGYPAQLAVGTLSTAACPSSGAGNDDDGIQVLWTTDGTAVGTVANASVTPSNAKSRAILALPAGANVSYARLYWTGVSANVTPSGNVTVSRGASSTTVSPEYMATIAHAGGTGWMASADATSLVQTFGDGSYDISGIDIRSDFKTKDDEWGGWYFVVFYQLGSEPVRNLTLFDHGNTAIDLISGTATVDINLSGFLVPAAGFDAKLGVFALEGDAALSGDYVSFGPTTSTLTRFSDQGVANPSTNNFFNGSRYWLGAPKSVSGDLPQTTGAAGSLTGIDIDVINVTSTMSSGQNKAVIRAGTTGETILLGGFATSITTFKPDFTSTTKQVRDINGDSLIVNDIVEYTITVTNTGSDVSTNTVIHDELPSNAVYVPGTLTLDGAPLSDTAGNDVGDVVGGIVLVRVGAGATAVQGGSMAVGETHTVKLRMKTTVVGAVLNQAFVTAGGVLRPDLGDSSWLSGDGAQTSAPTVVAAVLCTNHYGETGQVVCGQTNPFCVAGGCLPCNNAAAETTCSGDTPGCLLAGPLTGACTIVDTDGDGVFDPDERTFGTNPLNPDTDGDGLPDNVELSVSGSTGPWTAVDTDGDGIKDALDADSDNDGIPDATERDEVAGGTGADFDSDGIPNYRDADSDGDGILDAEESGGGGASPRDTDGAEKPDYLDLDSDNDGYSDAVEAGADKLNPANTDSDVPVVADYIDLDSDNDCVPDATDPARTNAAVPKADANNNCGVGEVCYRAEGICLRPEDLTDAGTRRDAGRDATTGRGGDGSTSGTDQYAQEGGGEVAGGGLLCSASPSVQQNALLAFAALLLLTRRMQRRA